MSEPDEPRLSASTLKAIREEAIKQVAKWVIGFVCLLLGLTVAGWGFYLKEKLDQYVIAKAGGLPQSSVVAFDIREKCPEGWSNFNDAIGRVIIGSGKAAKLSQRDFSEKNGREEIALTLDNLPNHQHDTVVAVGPTDHTAVWGWGPSKPAIWGAHGGEVLTTAMTGPAGKNIPDPISLMPPYVVLRYCKKD